MEEANKLLDKYRSGNCTAEELRLLHNWFHHLGEHNLSRLTEADLLEAKDRFALQAARWTRKPWSVQWWPKIAAAAAILMVGGAGLFFYHGQRLVNTEGTFGSHIQPGGNKALLTLADGSTIALTEAKNGVLAQQAGTEITKTADGQLVYEDRMDSHRAETNLNTIETPKGGQYQVRLPDGTKVWLNAASKLAYPASFANQKERTVSLSGEAYFEVAKDKQHPFHVKTKNQDVQVLGTHFNINSYPDEQSTKTTLLEGSVSISLTPQGKRPATSPPYLKEGWSKTGVVLTPNHQSILAEGKLTIIPVDPDEAIAWQKGYFQFAHQNLAGMMRQISRWYNVEIEYQGNPDPLVTFSGMVSRFEKIEKVFRRMELTGQIKFKIEGKKVIVISPDTNK